jgi:hypothetical protein
MHSSKKLSLRRENLVELATDDLRALAGGDVLTVDAACLIHIGQPPNCSGNTCSCNT